MALFAALPSPLTAEEAKYLSKKKKKKEEEISRFPLEAFPPPSFNEKIGGDLREERERERESCHFSLLPPSELNPFRREVGIHFLFLKDARKRSECWHIAFFSRNIE